VNDERKKTALIATPVARDRAIEQLQEHFARSHIDVDALEALVERAERAKTDAELVALFDGLPVLATPTEALQVASPGRLSQPVRALLGSTSRRGRWRVPSLLRVRAWLGSVDLDLSEAELSRGDTVIEVHATLGSVTIVVPEGLAVECEGAAILGSFDHYDIGAQSGRDPRRVRIVGRALLGTVDVIVKKRSGALQQIGEGIKALLTGR
jgi:hypothetical protein